MKHIGFSDKTIKWFHSYLINRAFFISLDNEFLEVGTINCRFPQESILGHLLLSLYLNYISQALPDSHRSLYVDDVSIFYQHTNIAEIGNVLNKQFANVCK